MLNLIEKLRQYRRDRYLRNLIDKGLSLGRNVQINDGVFLDPSHCFLITIKDRVVLAPCVRLIAHDASMFRFIGITRIGRITIESDCFIGDSTIVLPGVRIGTGCVIGAGSVVVRDIPPHSVAVGNPAKVIGGLDEFLARHKALKEKGRAFDEERYNILRISDEGKKEMLEYLNAHVAYMQGDIPQDC